MAAAGKGSYDYLIKLLLIGDSGSDAAQEIKRFETDTRLT